MVWLDIIRVLIVVVVAIVGGYISRRATNRETGWLFDPSRTQLSPRQPPAWVFGVVWIILYAIYALVWVAAGPSTFGWFDVVFIVAIGLNLLWVYMFFGRRDATAARIIILIMIALALYQAYLVWISGSSYAAVLTFGILIYAAWLVVATGLTFATTFI